RPHEQRQRLLVVRVADDLVVEAATADDRSRPECGPGSQESATAGEPQQRGERCPAAAHAGSSPARRHQKPTFSSTQRTSQSTAGMTSAVTNPVKVAGSHDHVGIRDSTSRSDTTLAICAWTLAASVKMP